MNTFVGDAVEETREIMSNFISSPSDRKRRKNNNKIKQLLYTVQHIAILRRMCWFCFDFLSLQHEQKRRFLHPVDDCAALPRFCASYTGFTEKWRDSCFLVSICRVRIAGRASTPSCCHDPAVHLWYCTLGVGANPSSFFCTCNVIHCKKRVD